MCCPAPALGAGDRDQLRPSQCWAPVLKVPVPRSTLLLPTTHMSFLALAVIAVGLTSSWGLGTELQEGLQTKSYFASGTGAPVDRFPVCPEAFFCSSSAPHPRMRTTRSSSAPSAAHTLYRSVPDVPTPLPFGDRPSQPRPLFFSGTEEEECREPRPYCAR